METVLSGTYMKQEGDREWEEEDAREDGALDKGQPELHP